MSEASELHESGCACTFCGGRIEGLWRDYAYGLPDRVFALPPEERARRTWQSAELNPDLVVLDDSAFFVRGLLPVPLQGGEEFQYGVWLEVSLADFQQVMRTWDDDAAYLALRFRARLANALAPWGERALGAGVDVATYDASQRPRVTGADDPWLTELLREGWDQATYEPFARSIMARHGA